MIVTPVKSRNADKPTPVAFIGGLLALFPQGAAVVAGTPVEVMITGILYHKDPQYGNLDFNKPRCLLIRQITDEDIPVDFFGFETAGSMCTTSAIARLPDATTCNITPGRTGVYAADNVNVGWKGQVKQPLRPGRGWVQLIPNRLNRLVGVAEHTMLQYFVDKDK